MYPNFHQFGYFPPQEDRQMGMPTIVPTTSPPAFVRAQAQAQPFPLHLYMI
ncbi:hypothetical protein M3181_16570 [Mesobacillus maritimus]|uniref:hypothetical protein n=1 Tax=Mesobacillus maritimus TaxID=1643336 RepID=UPI002041A015|nr:hypothetical protein [Mesobacillus maritimus]MCM3670578.1 hypothetical protein [Mesobacillus maritimus]